MNVIKAKEFFEHQLDFIFFKSVPKQPFKRIPQFKDFQYHLEIKQNDNKAKELILTYDTLNICEALLFMGKVIEAIGICEKAVGTIMDETLLLNQGAEVFNNYDLHYSFSVTKRQEGRMRKTYYCVRLTLNSSLNQNSIIS